MRVIAIAAACVAAFVFAGCDSSGSGGSGGSGGGDSAGFDPCAKVASSVLSGALGVDVTVSPGTGHSRIGSITFSSCSWEAASNPAGVQFISVGSYAGPRSLISSGFKSTCPSTKPVHDGLPAGSLTCTSGHHITVHIDGADSYDVQVTGSDGASADSLETAAIKLAKAVAAAL